MNVQNCFGKCFYDKNLLSKEFKKSFFGTQILNFLLPSKKFILRASTSCMALYIMEVCFSTFENGEELCNRVRFLFFLLCFSRKIRYYE